MEIDPKLRYTTDQFVRLEDCDDYELIDGRPEPLSNGARSSRVAVRLGSLLLSSERSGRGLVFGSSGYCCFPNRPDLVRRPSLSFIAGTRMSKDVIPDVDPIRIAPDVVVRIVTTADKYESIELSMRDWRDAGTRLIWVISPETKSVLIRRLDGTCSEYFEADELSGEDVIPGFTCKVAELFI